MTKLLAFLTLVLTLVLACGPVDTNGNLHLPAVDSYEFWIDDSVDSQNATAVAVGVQQWTTFTDVQIAVHYGHHVCLSEGCFGIEQVPERDLDAVVGEHYIGWTVPYLITLTPAPTWDEAQDTAVHEEGHALGLWHPCEAPCSDYALMNPTYEDGADRIVCADVSMYYLARNRPIPSTLTPCTNALGEFETPDGEAP